jgi:hypothetical protein
VAWALGSHCKVTSAAIAKVGEDILRIIRNAKTKSEK